MYKKWVATNNANNKTQLLLRRFQVAVQANETTPLARHSTLKATPLRAPNRPRFWRPGQQPPPMGKRGLRGGPSTSQLQLQHKVPSMSSRCRRDTSCNNCRNLGQRGTTGLDGGNRAPLRRLPLFTCGKRRTRDVMLIKNVHPPNDLGGPLPPVPLYNLGPR